MFLMQRDHFRFKYDIIMYKASKGAFEDRTPKQTNRIKGDGLKSITSDEKERVVAKQAKFKIEVVDCKENAVEGIGSQ
jgi:hypothetical protein